MNEEKKIIEEKSVEKIYENLLIIYSFLVMWDTEETEMIDNVWLYHFFLNLLGTEEKPVFLIDINPNSWEKNDLG